MSHLPQPYGPQDPVPAELQPTSDPYAAYVQPWPGASGVFLRVARTSWTPVAIPLRVVVDQRVVPAGLGDTFVPLAPGDHQVVVAYQKPNGDDLAVQPVTVRPGEVVPVHYSLPRWAYAGGSIGLTPQPHKGGAIYVLLLLPLVLVLIMLFLVFGLLFAL